MSQFTQEPLRFPPVDGLSVRADFDGGAMSSDFGPLILRGVDQQIGLTERLAQVIDDRRHPSDVTHLLRDRIAQRTFQIDCGYADGNDANALRRDPLFKLGVERRPLDEAMDLASGPTFSRLENAVSTKDIDRMAQAFVDPFIASYPEAPEV
ncbi:transposase, partial [uncultured Thiocystis sp.]|uniref:transposase n=1 Tax=uncultured Thiocystis sp. TaxID=1202134 RepID=UPI0025F7F084